MAAVGGKEKGKKEEKNVASPQEDDVGVDPGDQWGLERCNRESCRQSCHMPSPCLSHSSEEYGIPIPLHGRGRKA